MRPGRSGLFLGAMLLLGCEHSMPPSGVADRWTGPWRDGAPAQLTAFPVNVIGLSADGAQVLYTKQNRLPQTDPDGKRSTRDTADVCLGLLPAAGGSGTFMDCDRRAGQLDSLNRLVTAAVDAAGRTLSVVSVGPIDTVVPVREHLELYLGNTRDKGDRRRLMTLYHDIAGQAVVPSGTLNWLTDIAWLDADRFIALGHHSSPALTLQLSYLGLVIGQIGPDSATTTLLTDRPRPFQIAAGPGGTILLAYGSGEIVAIAANGDARWTSRVPLAPGARMLGVGCYAGGCLAVTEEAVPGSLQRWIVGPGHEQATAAAVSQAENPISRLYVSSRDGALIFTMGGGLFRFD